MQQIVIEALNRIAGTAAEHLPMLYLSEELNGNARSRRREEALQVYIKCRLQDLMPDKMLERETEVRYRRRQDIKVMAPQIDGNVATVVIEIKWSDNPDVSTSLAAQLGQMYLIPEGLTHGIYLVGWNGKLKWKSSAGARPKGPSIPSALTDTLRLQAEAFSDDHADVDVQAIVLDLAWPK